MYIDFYGLVREPFRTTPDADSLYFSPSHREALGSILYGIKERKGVIVVTGEVGVGKTTILRRYLQIAEPAQQKTIHIYNPNLTFARLLIVILDQLGMNPAGESEAEMVSQLHEAALAEHGRDGTVVLVVDEAQCMPVETLEGIRMLTNLETSNEKLIQIVLMGQPELEALLERHELRHVRERIAVRGRILPLTNAESLGYIQHRLEQASREQQAIFSSAALSVIVKAAHGIPRRLNILCDNALITGFRHRAPVITRKIAKLAIADIGASRPPALWKSREAVALATVFALALPVIGYLSVASEMPWSKSDSPIPESAQHHSDSATPRARPHTPPAAGPGKEPGLAGSGRAGATDKEPVMAGSGRAGEEVKEPVVAGSGRGSENGKEPMLTGSARTGENGKEPAAMSARINEAAVTPILTGTAMVSADKAEVSETARLLAVLLDSGRVVLGRAQPAINNPRLEDKGFSSSVFEARLRKEFLARTGHDLHNLAPAPMPDAAKPLLVKLNYFMQKAVQDVQADINKKGIGFKGFIPATFATKVAASFSKDTGLKLRQIGPPDVDPRNPENKPDEQEKQTLSAVQKSHPRVGDHVIEQQLPDNSVRVLLPLFYNKQCLACHGKPKGEIDISGYEKEGFKEGDLGGAISVILPTVNNVPNPKPADGEQEG